MKRGALIVLIIALSIGGTAYLASDSYYLGAGVAIAFFLGLVLFALPGLRRHGERNRLRHECYLFVHSYLVTLSVCMSLERAYESGASGLGEEFRRLNGNISAMDAKEKTEYLASYFQSDLYQMFLSILQLFLDRGGDILKLSNELTQEVSRVEETEQIYEKEAKRKAIGFFFLWLLSLAIIVFVRFGLSSFFQTLKQSWTYLGSLGIFYLFLLGSSLYFLRSYTGERWFAPKIKKGESHEAV